MRFFFPCHYDGHATSVCSAHPGSQDEADILQSLQTNGRHDVRKKNSWGLQPVRFWGCLFPTMILHILTATHFCLQDPIGSNSTDFSELFPHLFSLSPFCSARLTVLECISLIPNLGSFHCSKCFMATSLHAPLLHPNLCSNVSFLERMSLTMCLTQHHSLFSLSFPFQFSPYLPQVSFIILHSVSKAKM